MLRSLTVAVAGLVLGTSSIAQANYYHPSGGLRAASKQYCYPTVKVTTGGNVSVDTKISNGQKISFATFYVTIEFIDEDDDTVLIVTQKGQLNGAGAGGANERVLRTRTSLDKGTADTIVTHRATCETNDATMRALEKAAKELTIIIFQGEF